MSQFFLAVATSISGGYIMPVEVASLAQILLSQRANNSSGGSE
jgi:hypothetical protein